MVMRGVIVVVAYSDNGNWVTVLVSTLVMVAVIVLVIGK